MSGNLRKTVSPPTLEKGKRRRVESVNLVDDVVDLKEKTVVLHDGVRRLESIAGRMGPDTVCIRKALGRLQDLVSEMFGDGLDDIVSEVETYVAAYLDGINLDMLPVEGTNPEGNERVRQCRSFSI